MEAYIISDLHLGSKYSRYREFLDFVRGLPQDAALILNGDVVNHRIKPKYDWDEQKGVLDFLREESEKRQIIWIRGNNDRKYELKNPCKIEFCNEYSIGKRLYITHGHKFDRLMPRARWALWIVGALYTLRRFFGASDIHIAEYVKRLPLLYNVLCTHIANNATDFAREHNYEAVTCGHTHCAADIEKDGIRYLNTGAWTEPDAAMVVVDENMIRLDYIQNNE